ncbi:MAG: site-specific integrase [Nitrososphaerales archaeon]
MPTVTFEIPKPQLLSKAQIEAEIRIREAYIEIVNGIVDRAIPAKQTTASVNALTTTPSDIDWARFSDWLDKQYSRSHAKAIFSFALKYYQAAFDTAKAAELKTMTLNKQHYVMEALSAFSKYSGTYDRWQAVKKATGLKWSTKNAAQIVQGILSQESSDAIDWLESTLPKIPRAYRLPLVFAAVSGLRIGEACKACELIYNLNEEGKLDEYYDEEMSMLQHFKFPKLFLRRTKNAYISFVSKQLVEIISRTEPKSYLSINSLLKRRGLPIRIRQLRKTFATHLRKHIEREFVDILQGRVDASVFAQHYYRPQLLPLRKKTLRAIKPLEQGLLVMIKES